MKKILEKLLKNDVFDSFFALLKNKWLWIGSALAVFLLIIWFRPQSSTPSKLPPVKTVPPKEITAPFKLLEVSPKSGLRSTADSFEYIKFTFSGPVDVKKVKISVSPSINLIPKVYEKEPHVLWIIPDTDMWKPQTRYSLLIDKTLSSVSGATLSGDIEYVYYNDPPESVVTGENFFIPE